MNKRIASFKGVRSDIEVLAVLHVRSVHGVSCSLVDLVKDCDLSERRLRDVIKRLLSGGVLSHVGGAAGGKVQYAFTGVYHGRLDGFPVVYVNPHNERFIVIEVPGQVVELEVIRRV